MVGRLGTVYREAVAEYEMVHQIEPSPDTNPNTSVDCYSQTWERGQVQIYSQYSDFLNEVRDGGAAPELRDILAAFMGPAYEEFRMRVRLVYGCCPRNGVVRVSASTVYIGEHILDRHKRITFPVSIAGVEQTVCLEMMQRPLELTTPGGEYQGEYLWAYSGGMGVVKCSATGNAD